MLALRSRIEFIFSRSSQGTTSRDLYARSRAWAKVRSWENRTPTQWASQSWVTASSERVLVTKERLKAMSDCRRAHDHLVSFRRARLDKVSQPVLLYPYCLQKMSAASRLSPEDLSLIGSHLT